MRYFLIFTSFLYFTAHPAAAGVRELCRSELSGRMITASSDQKMYEDLVLSLKESLEPMSVERKRLESDHDKKSNSKDKGNIYSEQELNQLKTRMNALGQQISELKTEQEKAKSNLNLAKEKVKTLESQLKKLFEFTRVQEPEAGLMTWRLDYKSACPKYRENCPLSEHMRSHLRSILGSETPENCVKYSYIK